MSDRRPRRGARPGEPGSAEGRPPPPAADPGTPPESQSSERPPRGRRRGREPRERGGREPGDRGGREPGDRGGREPGGRGGREPGDRGGREPGDRGGDRRRGRRRGAGRKRGKPPPAAKPEGEESAGPPKDGKQTPLSKKDCLFIVVVLTSEVVHVVLTVFLRQSTKRLFDKQSTEDVIERGVVAMLVLGLLITAIMVVVNILGLLKKLRYWFIFGGLSVYFVCTSVLGFTLSSENTAMATVMFAWTGIWYGVHPLRFMFVFHQYFPMRTTHSHQLTAGCLIIIWLVEYILYLWVSPDTYDGTSKIQWGVALILAAAWMGGLFAANMWRNKTPDEISPVRQVYSKTKYLLQFDRRQKKACIISLWLVVSQWVTFTVVKTVVMFSFDQMREGQDIPPVFHRFDLIITIIVTLLIEVLFFALRRYQSELIDLLLISLAFIVTIILLIIVLAALQKEPEEEDSSLNAKPIYEKDDWKNEPGIAKLVLYHAMLNEAIDKKYMYSIDGRSYGNSILRKNKLLAQIPINSPREVDVRVFSYLTGELYKETQLKLEPNSKAMYVDRHSKWEISQNIEGVSETEIWPQVVLVNFMKKCTHSEYIKGLFDETLVDIQKDRRAIPGGIKSSIPVKMENNVCRFCAPIYFFNKLFFILKNESETSINWKFNYFMTEKVIVMPPYDYDSPDIDAVELKFGDAKYYQNAAQKGHIKKSAYDKVGVTVWDLIFHVLAPVKMGRVSFYIVDPTLIRSPQRYGAARSKDAMCFERNFRTAIVYNETKPVEEPPPPYHLAEQTALGVVTGLVLVCYIHLLWTVSPIKWRVAIIYTCFGLAFVGEWLTILLLTEVTNEVIYALIALTIVSLIIHSLGSALFWLKVHRKKTSEEKKDPQKRY